MFGPAVFLARNPAGSLDPRGYPRRVKPFALLLGLALAACAHAPAETVRSISFVELSNGSGSITFQSPHAHGTVLVAPPLPVRCETRQVNFDVTTKWTVDGREFEFTGPELRLGGASYGALTGETAIEVRADGVFVNGEKRGELLR